MPPHFELALSPRACASPRLRDDHMQSSSPYKTQQGSRSGDFLNEERNK